MTPDTLRATLDRLDLKPAEAAEFLGVHRVTIYKWFSAEQPIPPWVGKFLTYVEEHPRRARGSSKA